MMGSPATPGACGCHRRAWRGRCALGGVVPPPLMTRRTALRSATEIVSVAMLSPSLCDILGCRSQEPPFLLPPARMREGWNLLGPCWASLSPVPSAVQGLQSKRSPPGPGHPGGMSGRWEEVEACVLSERWSTPRDHIWRMLCAVGFVPGVRAALPQCSLRRQLHHCPAAPRRCCDGRGMLDSFPGPAEFFRGTATSCP